MDMELDYDVAEVTAARPSSKKRSVSLALPSNSLPEKKEKKKRKASSTASTSKDENVSYKKSKKSDKQAKKVKRVKTTKARRLMTKKEKQSKLCRADSFMKELLSLSFQDIQPAEPLPGIVRIGSDCSGLGTDAVAAKLSLHQERVEVRCAFVSDFDCTKLTLLRAMHKHAGLGRPSVIFQDVTQRHCEDLPEARLET